MQANSLEASAPPQERLLELLGGFRATQLISVAARLGLADLLAAGPTPSEELAAASKTDPEALGAVLQMLAEAGVLDEEPPGTFALNPISELLRADRPDSLRERAIEAGEIEYRLWAGLLAQVERPLGRPVEAGGTAWFEDYALASDRRMYGRMAATAAEFGDYLATSYDFAGIRKIVDVGGGYGSCLLSLLAHEPEIEGIVFDLGAIREGAERSIVEAGVNGRCVFREGDFFESVPAGADAYILMRVLRNWPDSEAVRLLSNCRRAAAAGGRILVVDPLLESPRRRPPLEVLSRRHLRTRAELESLFAAAELSVRRFVPLPDWGIIAEAEIASPPATQGDLKNA